VKAARFHNTGPADVLRMEEVPTPKPGLGEFLVNVRAAALNRMDVFLRSGATSMPGLTLPHTGGFDISGDIAAVGPDVDSKQVGKPIVVKARITGPTAKGRLDIIGISRPGGFAEYVLIPASAAVGKPERYSYEEAAAYPCVYLTAYYGLILRAALKPGETVLVQGGSSGAGVAAIQVAKLAGASVITTASNPQKAEKAKAIGADRVVNYRTEDLVAAVNDFTHNRGVDVVFDPVWGTSAPKTLDCFNYGGRWIVLGMVGGLNSDINVAKIMFKEVTIRGIIEFFATDDDFAGAMNLAHQDLIRPVIDKVWPLEKIADAHRQMESGDFFGKIVVKP